MQELPPGAGKSPRPPSKQRKRRRDAGKKRLNARDMFALTWIGQQYALRLDHLQWLLGRAPGHGARYSNWISESAARDSVNRWEQMGYIHAERIRDKQPFWIWLSRKGLRKIGLPYGYRDLEESSLKDLEHLYAINAVRLRLEADYDTDLRWTSERALLHGQVREKGKRLLHRPDGVIVLANGDRIAIECELSTKKPFALTEILLELLRGEEYLRAKEHFGWQTARNLCHRDRSAYDGIWYFAPKPIRRQVRRARSKLVAHQEISEEEAEDIYVYWYPPPTTEEEQTQEQHEEDESLGEESDETDDDETHLDQEERDR